jgi:beta-galactosidase
MPAMRRASFNDHWTLGAKANSFAEMVTRGGSEPVPVTLPHDAMIGEERSPSGHGATAYFPSGSWEYRKSFEPPLDEEGSVFFLEFDGVYRDARVSVNDVLVALRPGGYSDFSVQIDHLLRFGEANEVKVEARAHDDSRWYSGGGIYRSVWLLQGGRTSGTSCTTFDGRALAILRPTGGGRITLTVTAPGCEAQRVVIDARA